MAKAISLLTGWDIDKTRQLFSQPVNEINPGKVKKVVKILLAELEKDSN